MIKKCDRCQKTRHIYAKGLCSPCYQTTRLQIRTGNFKNKKRDDTTRQENLINTLFFLTLTNFIMTTIILWDKSKTLSWTYGAYVLIGTIWLLLTANKEENKK